MARHRHSHRAQSTHGTLADLEPFPTVFAVAAQVQLCLQRLRPTRTLPMCAPIFLPTFARFVAPNLGTTAAIRCLPWELLAKVLAAVLLVLVV